MPTYIADRACFIDNILRPEGVKFSVGEPIKDKSEWLKEVKMSKAELKALAEEREAAAAQAELDAAEVEIVTGKGDETTANADFLEGKELSPQQKAANTRKANKAAAAASGAVETL